MFYWPLDTEDPSWEKHTENIMSQTDARNLATCTWLIPRQVVCHCFVAVTEGDTGLKATARAAT